MGLKDTLISLLARNPLGGNQGPENLKSATNTVKRPDMERKTARTTPNEIYGLQPKYLQHNLWQANSELSPTTTEWSEMAPLLCRSLFELSNSVA